jgi:DNA-binding protein
MGRNVTAISLAGMEKIMRKAGADRVSEDAKDALREVLEEYGCKISSKALVFAEHAGRKTIKASDIKLVMKTF